MAKKSREGNLNHAIREKFKDVPDPLHFELPYHHKKLLEAIYIIAVAGAIFSLLFLGSLGVMTSDQMNSSIMLVVMLAILLAILIIEKATIAHKPLKSSS